LKIIGEINKNEPNILIYYFNILHQI